MNKHYRQGDVFLVEVDALPADAVEKSVSEELVLALGEVTGHSHRLRAPQGATLYAVGDTNIFQIKQSSELVHEEHSTLFLTPGLYKVVIQREYTPERITRVID